jgi:hypothetical protein
MTGLLHHAKGHDPGEDSPNTISNHQRVKAFQHFPQYEVYRDVSR